jgi:tyramine---L-glutamate ligase
MRILIYEYLTANGIGQAFNSPGHGMYLEGRAMRDALFEDFSALRDIKAVAFPDEAAPVSQESFEEMCKLSDWTILIAPAFDNCLSHLAESVHRAGGHLLVPSLDAIRLTSDKLNLFNHWRSHQIPTPATSERDPTACEAFPVVWKPRDGAGSNMTFLLNSAQGVARAKAIVATEGHRGPMIFQEYISGEAASIAFLCGPCGNMPLLPASQLLSHDGRFSYQGGKIPLAQDLAERAVKLGQQAVDCIPGLRGYVGVDLVLGSAEDRSRDYAIEINPRLTTSYVGLRRLADFNLAEAMLKTATNSVQVAMKWRAERIHFKPNGFIANS